MEGREWRPEGALNAVNVHDLKDPVLGKVNPYGVYGIAADTGWVSVGADHDTSAFAVNTVRSWWQAMGRGAYPEAARLLITADGGGSNGYRTRLWKTELAQVAAETGLPITVCHLPPGTFEVEQDRASTVLPDLRSTGVLTRSPGAKSWSTASAQPHHRERRPSRSSPSHRRLPRCRQDSRQQIRDLEDRGVLHRHQRGEWNYTINPNTPSR